MIVSLILASASQARRAMLESAGISFSVEPAAVDEGAIKRSLRSQGAAVSVVAEALAVEKAEVVSRRHSSALVIGSDQMLSCNGRWFDKPADRAAARAQLMALRGHRHELTAAVVVVSGGMRLWRHVDRAELVMRPFSESFVDEYLDRTGDDACQSVGAYRIEGPGVQLFEAIHGDVFTIMGMPLLPLLGFLRAQGVVPT
jgi:septum formation protein